MPDLDLEARLAAGMAAAQRGDKRAYEALLRGCLPIVTAIVRRQGVSPAAVDDVAQEVLMTIHKARATYDPARPFLPWLRAIAQHRALDAIRHYRRVQGRESSEAEAFGDLADETPSALQMIEQADQKREIGTIVASLPEGQRQAVESLVLRENSLAEASAETGRTTGALKVNLHRALKALRGKLGPERDTHV